MLRGCELPSCSSTVSVNSLSHSFCAVPDAEVVSTIDYRGHINHKPITHTHTHIPGDALASSELPALRRKSEAPTNSVPTL
jgi:hypothetical protein